MRSRRGRRKKRRARINFRRLAVSLSIIIIATFTVAIHFMDNDILDKASTAYAGSKHDDEVKSESEDELVYDEEKADVSVDEEIVNITDDGKTEDAQNPQTRVSNPNDDYKNIFKKDVFIGDSITEGLSAYELLEESNIFAGLGATVLEQEKKLDEIAKVEPENIYILLGVNDILTGIDSEKFASNYAQFVQAIKEKLPDSNIYIQSILPVSSKVAIKKPLLTNVRINEFNAALRSMSENEGAIYLDIASVTDEYNSLYAKDGIHLKSSFYKLWLNYLISNTK